MVYYWISYRQPYAVISYSDLHAIVEVDYGYSQRDTRVFISYPEISVFVDTGEFEAQPTFPRVAAEYLYSLPKMRLEYSMPVAGDFYVELDSKNAFVFDHSSVQDSVSITAAWSAYDTARAGDEPPVFAVVAALQDDAATSEQLAFGLSAVLHDAALVIDGLAMRIDTGFADSVDAGDSQAFQVTAPLSDSSAADDDINRVDITAVLSDAQVASESTLFNFSAVLLDSAASVEHQAFVVSASLADSSFAVDHAAFQFRAPLNDSALHDDSTAFSVTARSYDESAASDALAVEYTARLQDAAAASEFAVFGVTGRLYDNAAAGEQIQRIDINAPLHEVSAASEAQAFTIGIESHVYFDAAEIDGFALNEAPINGSVEDYYESDLAERVYQSDSVAISARLSGVVDSAQQTDNGAIFGVIARLGDQAISTENQVFALTGVLSDSAIAWDNAAVTMAMPAQDDTIAADSVAVSYRAQLYDTALSWDDAIFMVTGALADEATPVDQIQRVDLTARLADQALAGEESQVFSVTGWLMDSVGASESVVVSWRVDLDDYAAAWDFAHFVMSGPLYDFVAASEQVQRIDITAPVFDAAATTDDQAFTIKLKSHIYFDAATVDGFALNEAEINGSVEDYYESPLAERVYQADSVDITAVLSGVNDSVQAADSGQVFDLIAWLYDDAGRTEYLAFYFGGKLADGVSTSEATVFSASIPQEDDVSVSESIAFDLNSELTDNTATSESVVCDVKAPQQDSTDVVEHLAFDFDSKQFDGVVAHDSVSFGLAGAIQDDVATAESGFSVAVFMPGVSDAVQQGDNVAISLSTKLAEAASVSDQVNVTHYKTSYATINEAAINEVAIN